MDIRGRYVPTLELLYYVWGDEVVRTHIKYLRKVLPEGVITSLPVSSISTSMESSKALSISLASLK